MPGDTQCTPTLPGCCPLPPPLLLLSPLLLSPPLLLLLLLPLSAPAAASHSAARESLSWTRARLVAPYAALPGVGLPQLAGHGMAGGLDEGVRRGRTACRLAQRDARPMQAEPCQSPVECGVCSGGVCCRPPATHIQEEHVAAAALVPHARESGVRPQQRACRAPRVAAGGAGREWHRHWSGGGSGWSSGQAGRLIAAARPPEAPPWTCSTPQLTLEKEGSPLILPHPTLPTPRHPPSRLVSTICASSAGAACTSGAFTCCEAPALHTICPVGGGVCG